MHLSTVVSQSMPDPAVVSSLRGSLVLQNALMLGCKHIGRRSGGLLKYTDISKAVILPFATTHVETSIHTMLFFESHVRLPGMFHVPNFAHSRILVTRVQTLSPIRNSIQTLPERRLQEPLPTRFIHACPDTPDCTLYSPRDYTAGASGTL